MAHSFPHSSLGVFLPAPMGSSSGSSLGLGAGHLQGRRASDREVRFVNNKVDCTIRGRYVNVAGRVVRPWPYASVHTTTIRVCLGRPAFLGVVLNEAEVRPCSIHTRRENRLSSGNAEKRRVWQARLARYRSCWLSVTRTFCEQKLCRRTASTIGRIT